MNRIVLALTLLVGSWALACEQYAGSHLHVGSELSIRLGHLALDLRLAHPSPCPVLVAVVPVQPEYEPEEQFSPPPIVAAPVVMAPVCIAPVVAAPVVVAAQAPAAEVSAAREEEAPAGPSRLALKYLPGLSSSVTLGDSLVIEGIGFTQTAGLELRLGRFFALRTDAELRRDGRSFDVIGAKLALLPSSMLRPYGSVSLSLSDSPSLPGRIHVGLMGAAGLDLYFGRHFFIEAEVRYRRVPSCCADEPRFTGLVGAGVAFF